MRTSGIRGSREFAELELPAAVSSVSALTDNSFELVMDDADAGAAGAVRRLILCTGKLFYDLTTHRREHRVEGVALVRIEQLYPYPRRRIAEILERYDQATDIVWAQEEPANMGAWTFIHSRISDQLRGGRSIQFVGRPRSASPASGSHKRHLAEQEWLVGRVFEDRAPTETVAAGDADGVSS